MRPYTILMNVVFIVLQMILYVAFLTVDLTSDNAILSSYFKFTIIILCFCYALFSKNSTDKSILFCMKAALLFTLISDLFILILDYYLYGVLTFILVQQLYGIRLSMERQQPAIIKNFLIRLILQVGAAFIICFILQLWVSLESLLVAKHILFHLHSYKCDLGNESSNGKTEGKRNRAIRNWNAAISSL